MWLSVYTFRADRRSMEGRLNQQELLQACMVLNTADYCAETTAQVGIKLLLRCM